MIERWIEVNFAKEGIHRYPAAASNENLSTDDYLDVAFLAYPHRHMFHFKVILEVYHNDRDIEFIQLKRWLEKQYSDGVMFVNNKSCEMLAEDVYNLLQTNDIYKNRNAVIHVYEDNENGAILRFTK